MKFFKWNISISTDDQSDQDDQGCDHIYEYGKKEPLEETNMWWSHLLGAQYSQRYGAKVTCKRCGHTDYKSWTQKVYGVISNG